MKILITGALGHIGSYVINDLIKLKKIKKIYLLDNLMNNKHNSSFAGCNLLLDNIGITILLSSTKDISFTFVTNITFFLCFIIILIFFQKTKLFTVFHVYVVVFLMHQIMSHN